jgi:O-antigen/teichoic acid export membrane protein
MARIVVPHELKNNIRTYGWDKSEVARYYVFGIKVFINNVANSSLTFLDKVLIPVFVGPSNLTYYGIAGSVANKTPAVSNTFANVIFPMTASFEGAGDRERTKLLYIRSMRLITILSMSVTVTILSFPYKMLAYWISPEVAEHATATLIILAWTNFILSLSGPLTNFLVGMGRLRALTWSSVSAAVLNAILLLILLPPFGIYGAGLAYLLALIPFIVLFHWTEIRLLELAGRLRFYIIFAIKLSVTGFVTYVCNTQILAPHIYNFTTVLGGSAVSVIFFLAFYYVCNLFEPEDVRDLKLFSKSIFKMLRKA